MTGDKILGLLIIVTIAVHLAGIYALRHPGSFFAYTFYRRPFGPNTRTKEMTKGELARSGAQFLILGLYPFLTLVGLRTFKEQLETILSEGILMAIYFCCSIFFIACVVGGVYLLIRSLIRRSGYIPETSDYE
jgi:hypothetical protein